ncbi:MAG: hypothetical protein AB1422_05800 [bacterium]
MGNFSTSQDSLPFSYTFSFYIIHFTSNRTGRKISTCEIGLNETSPQKESIKRDFESMHTSISKKMLDKI